MDKVYLNTPTKIAIIDHELKRTFVVQKDGFPDAGEIPFKLDSIFCLINACHIYIDEQGDGRLHIPTQALETDRQTDRQTEIVMAFKGPKWPNKTT